MHTDQLLARGRPDQFADSRQLACLVRLDRKPERCCIRDRVPHAAVRNVDVDRPELVDLERRAELRDERRDIRQLDPLDAAVAACCPHLDDPARSLEPQHRLGLGHLDESRLEQTVATQIVFEPDIAGYSVGSMMM